MSRFKSVNTFINIVIFSVIVYFSGLLDSVAALLWFNAEKRSRCYEVSVFQFAALTRKF